MSRVTRSQATRAMREFTAEMENTYGDKSEREIAEINRKARELRAENARRAAL